MKFLQRIEKREAKVVLIGLGYVGLPLAVEEAKPAEVVCVLENMGFGLICQSGSHAVYRHPDGRWTTAPVHPGKDVAKRTLRV